MVELPQEETIVPEIVLDITAEVDNPPTINNGDLEHAEKW